MSPTDKVTNMLLAAREIAWEHFEAPSEETVITIFRRICLESDLRAPEPVEAPVSAVLH